MPEQNPFSHIDCTFEFRESTRARRISLKIKPPNKVILVVPVGVSFRKAHKFAQEHTPWVETKIANMKDVNPPVIITSQSDYKTKYHTLKFIPHSRKDGFIAIKEQETHICYPLDWEEEGERVQGLVSTAIRETYRREAKEYLPSRLHDLADSFGFQFNKVAIKDAKTRWGSCSMQKNINLSLHLMKLPYHLIDYIILHELCHTRVMNHGKDFYKLLDSVTEGKTMVLRKELKRFSINM
jgi:predicted metal-dependent hydrolase